MQVSSIYNNRPVLSNQRMMNFYNNRVRRVSLINEQAPEGTEKANDSPVKHED